MRELKDLKGARCSDQAAQAAQTNNFPWAYSNFSTATAHDFLYEPAAPTRNTFPLLFGEILSLNLQIRPNIYY